MKSTPPRRRVKQHQAQSPPQAESVVKRSGARDTLDETSFLASRHFTREDLERSGCSWEGLEWIHTLHRQRSTSLLATAQYLSERLRVVPAVHSLKVRVKDPASLVAKVIRKRLADADRVITPDNYATEITDLIGIRAMHLFKDDWRAIHDFINVTWTLHETPIAYYRAGDHQDVLAGFSESGCDLREHVAGYRSVHYIVESTPTKERTLAELQVRTVFEEAWSEIDHLVRYPNLTDDPVLNHFLGLFNRTAGMADEMGTFLQRLRNELQRRQAQADDAIAAHQNRIAALEEQVAALNIEKGQKEALERQLSEIRKGPAWSVGGLSGFTFDSPQPEIRFTYTPGIGSIGLNFGSDRPIADSWGGIVGLSRKCTSCGQTFASAPTFGDYDTRCPSCRAAR